MQASAVLTCVFQIAELSECAGSRALAWIGREFPRFDPLRGNVVATPDEEGQTALCELAWLLWVLKERASCKGDPKVDRCIAYLANAYERPSFHAYMLHGHPLAFTGHLIVYLSLMA